MPWFGGHYIDQIHIGTLHPWIDFRRKQGRKANTINHGLKVVRQILNLAASEWMDENGLTWLLAAPKVKLLPVTDMRKPYPLSVSEALLNLIGHYRNSDWCPGAESDWSALGTDTRIFSRI